MKVLVIGNGFDIAHELPTDYCSFICFLNNAKDKYDAWIRGNEKYYDRISSGMPTEYEDAKNPENWKVGDWLGIDSIFTDTAEKIKIVLLKTLGFSDISNMDTEELFRDDVFRKYNCIIIWFLVNSNRWYDYFLALRDNNDKSWCDIENHIYEVIETFTKNDIADVDSSLFEDLRLDRNASVDVISQCLYNELRQLTDYLEIYLTIFEHVAKLIKTKLNMKTGYKYPQKDYIKAIRPDMIVSLNYTTIYPIIYDDPDTRIHFVHGQIGYDNMVFGIKSVGSGKYKDEVFKNFNKLSQIKKFGLDNAYNKELCEKNNVEIHIFGCSLSPLDEHIFLPLLLGENLLHCIIYCLEHEKNRIKSNVENLPGIMSRHDILKKIEYKTI